MPPKSPPKRVVKTPLRPASEYKLGQKVMGRLNTGVYLCALHADGESHQWKPFKQPRGQVQGQQPVATLLQQPQNNNPANIGDVIIPTPMDVETSKTKTKKKKTSSKHTKHTTNNTNNISNTIYKRYMPSYYKRLSCFCHSEQNTDIPPNIPERPRNGTDTDGDCFMT